MFEINDNDNAFVKYVKNEVLQSIEFYKDKGNDDKIKFIKIAAKLIMQLSEFGSDYNLLHSVQTNIDKFIKYGLFSPLTLNEGEFIYTKPGLSINRRFNRICNTVEGMYDDGAYKINVIDYYDVINNIYTNDDYICEDGEEANGDQNRVYLSTGGLITDIYFNRCYIKDSDIELHSYIPKHTYAINVCKVIIGKQYINVVKTTDNIFQILDHSYDINFTKDNNNNNKIFGLTYNIKVNGLRSKRRTF